MIGLGKSNAARLQSAIVAESRWSAPFPLEGAFRIPITVRPPARSLHDAPPRRAARARRRHRLEAGQTRRFVADTPGPSPTPPGAASPSTPTARCSRCRRCSRWRVLRAARPRPGRRADGSVVVGTGHPARIYSVRDGKQALLGEVAADQVTALLVDPQGTVWAATAVRPSSSASAPRASSRPWPPWPRATSGPRLVPRRPRRRRRQPRQAAATHDKGLETAANVPIPTPLPGGERRHAVRRDLGQGLVVRWSGEGPVVVLADSTFTEIASLAVAADGA